MKIQNIDDKVRFEGATDLIGIASRHFKAFISLSLELVWNLYFRNDCGKYGYCDNCEYYGYCEY